LTDYAYVVDRASPSPRLCGDDSQLLQPAP
jgi:hypothetical protein